MSVCLERAQEQEPQCSWTAWSPCTVTCLSRGLTSVFAQQWQQYICRNLSSLDINSSIATSKFRSCADVIPLCISDEGFAAAFQNFFFLIILLLGILLVFLPNMILGLRYSRIWVWKSRKFGQRSEKSVLTLKEAISDKKLLSERG